MKEKIKQIVLELGADLCGIANVDRFTDAPNGFNPKDLYEECKSVIVFAKCIPKGLAKVDPRIIYIKATDVNLDELDRISYLSALEIEKLDATAIPLPSDSPYDYWDNNTLEGRGLISMKHAALLAGLGSLGKNTLIMNNKYGNMINIGAVLTNLDLESDPIAEEVCIENCHLCIDQCPQNALNGTSVNQKRCREFTYSKNDRGFSICNCNRCRAICPRAFGQKQS
ncbi:MAG: epoxyqueuosine reductase [Firmicutes bacterium HGW-Firmicutes-1]|jgi:epoxyqueuosine reductase QueG|nr:MAG: epoxyqueuosine reductase [Firmicutes bacterium HGW-Firmicutes-1]